MGSLIVNATNFVKVGGRHQPGENQPYTFDLENNFPPDILLENVVLKFVNLPATLVVNGGQPMGIGTLRGGVAKRTVDVLVKSTKTGTHCFTIEPGYRVRYDSSPKRTTHEVRVRK